MCIHVYTICIHKSNCKVHVFVAVHMQYEEQAWSYIIYALFWVFKTLFNDA